MPLLFLPWLKAVDVTEESWRLKHVVLLHFLTANLLIVQEEQHIHSPTHSGKLRLRSTTLKRCWARIIHERFCCNHRSAATTSLRPAGSPLESSPYSMSKHRVLRSSRAGLATRLSDFATNLHEEYGPELNRPRSNDARAPSPWPESPSPVPVTAHMQDR